MELPNTEHFYDPQRDENLAGVFLGSSLELTVASLLSKKENVPDCKNSVFQNYLPFINSSPWLVLEFALVLGENKKFGGTYAKYC